MTRGKRRLFVFCLSNCKRDFCLKKCRYPSEYLHYNISFFIMSNTYFVLCYMLFEHTLFWDTFIVFSLPLTCSGINYFTFDMSGCSLGRITVNVLPTPCVLSAIIFPPCACTIAFAMVSPIPAPPVRRFLDLSVL